MNNDASPIGSEHEAANVANPPPAVDEVQRVDAEPMESREYHYGRRAGAADIPAGGARLHVFSSHSGAALSMLKPPTLSTWICLAIAWLFLGSRIPFTVFLGIPFDLVALLLATVCLSRGGLLTGVGVLLLGTVGSIIVYIIGLFRFLVHI